MEAKFKYLLYGTLVGVFLSGLTVVLIGTTSNNDQIDKYSNLQISNSLPSVNSTACMIASDGTDSNSLKLDINLPSLEEFVSLPGIGDVKEKIY